MNVWTVNCMEERYPGLWYTWFRDQAAAVGWPPDDFQLEGGSGGHGWGSARISARSRNRRFPNCSTQRESRGEASNKEHKQCRR